MDADTFTVYPAADNYDVSTDISLSEEKPRENSISIEKYRKLPLSKQKCKTDFDCREILKQLKSLITDTAALKELKGKLIEVEEKFSKHTPVNHGVVEEHPKAKMELEKNVKRKFESLPLPRKKIELTGTVGVASKARKFSSIIGITKNIRELSSLTFLVLQKRI